MKNILATLVLIPLLLPVGSARAADGYVAHEWGTFTSVQGADGVQLEWNQPAVSELPGFVYGTPQRPVLGGPAFLTKSVGGARQRMETPVIYFYSDQAQTVEATVDFPQGRMTEWYPRAAQAVPARGPSLARASQGLLRWDKVEILPPAGNARLAAILPMDKSGSHYYAARATDANLVRVLDPAAAAKEQIEKFLFYRGVGHFTAPLTVTQLGEGEQLQLLNTGTEELRDLFVYTVRDGRGKFMAIDRLPAGTNRLVKFAPNTGLSPLSTVREELGRQMQAGLVREGLYKREAAAMVQTWDDAWFGETGTRVLYTLPRAWTDRVLPLALEPRPRELERVMVGRAELITPAVDWQLTRLVARYIEAGQDAAERAQVVEEARALGLGRFLEPATRRLAGKLAAREFVKASSELMQAASKPATPDKPLAGR